MLRKISKCILAGRIPLRERPIFRASTADFPGVNGRLININGRLTGGMSGFCPDILLPAFRGLLPGGTSVKDHIPA
jgi:hypothetical protein